MSDTAPRGSSAWTWQGSRTPGDHYFICGVGNHCRDMRMKLAVRVSSDCSNEDTWKRHGREIIFGVINLNDFMQALYY